MFGCKEKITGKIHAAENMCDTLLNSVALLCFFMLSNFLRLKLTLNGTVIWPLIVVVIIF